MLEGVWMKGALNKLIRSTEEFYKDPEHEKEFQEWLAQRQREQEQGNKSQPA
jgi:hypothetical protein